MKNTVIKVLNREHGKQVIQWWKDQGINTKNYEGISNEEDEDKSIYYGEIDGYFNNYNLEYVQSNNATITELPTPKEDDLLAEVRRRYPIGTKFCPGHIMPSTEYCIVTNANFKIEGDYIYSLTDEGGSHSNNLSDKYGNTYYNRVVRNNKGEWATIIETPLSLLDQAKAKYPVGTRYITASNDWNAEHIVTEQSFSLPSEDKVYAEDGKGCLYYEGKWAKILPSIKTENILEKARRLYPVGTRFKCAKDGEEGVSITEVEIYHDDDLFSKFAGRGCNQYVYLADKDKWAEIVETPKEQPSKFVIGKWYTAEGYYGKLCGEVTSDRFPCTEYFHKSGKYQKDGYFFNGYDWKDAKEVDLSKIQKYLPDGHPDKFKPVEKWSVGSYVVFLEDYGGHSKGTVSKIIEDSSKHNVQVEHLYNSMPRNGCKLSKDRECKWFATLQEAEKFAATLKEPVKPILVKEDLVGRYIKALVDRPNSGGVMKNEIGIITACVNSESVLIDFPSQSCYSASYKNGKYELMSKDYQPHVEKPIEIPTEIRMGRWVKVVKDSTSEKHPIGTYLQMKTEINHLDCFWVYGFDRCLSTTEVEIMPEGFIPPSASIMLDHSDVTLTFTLPHVEEPAKENLVGRWVKSLVDRPNGCYIKAGEYAKIVDVTDLSIRLDLPYSPFISASSLGKHVMLMPKEFKRAEIAEEMWSRINRPVDSSSKDSIGRIKVKKRAVKKLVFFNY